jgi:membrane protease YdiL (CAAX protease family)
MISNVLQKRVMTAMRQCIADHPVLVLWGYLLVITMAELLTSFVSPLLGQLLHTLLLIGLVILGVRGHASARRRMTLALTLAPLIRVLSLSMPLSRFPLLAWYPLVAVPLLIATMIVIRQLRLSRRDLGLRLGNPLLQLMLAGSGLVLGLAEHYILMPQPLISSFSTRSVALASLTLLVATGFTEELIFRGVLQSVAGPALGRWALVYVVLLFTVLHIGYFSALEVVFVLGVGLLFGYMVRWGGSIVGVALAHGLINMMLFLIVPYMEQYPNSPIAAVASWATLGGAAAAVVALAILALQARRQGQPGSLLKTSHAPPRSSADARTSSLDRRVREQGSPKLGQFGMLQGIHDPSAAIVEWPTETVIRGDGGQSLPGPKVQRCEIERGAMGTPETRQLEPNSSELDQQVGPIEIEQVIEQIGARYVANLRTLSEKLHRFYTGQLTVKDREILELSRRLEVAERERDELASLVREFRRMSEQYIAHWQALKEESSHDAESTRDEPDTLLL